MFLIFKRVKKISIILKFIYFFKLNNLLKITKKKTNLSNKE